MEETAEPSVEPILSFGLLILGQTMPVVTGEPLGFTQVVVLEPEVEEGILEAWEVEKTVLSRVLLVEGEGCLSLYLRGTSTRRFGCWKYKDG